MGIDMALLPLAYAQDFHRPAGHSLHRKFVSAFDFGAQGDGISDDTAALRNALATAAPVDLGCGRFRLTSGLSLWPGQVLQGASSRCSSIIVDHVFDRSAPAVIDIRGPEPGGEVRDLTISFAQPDAGERAVLLPYPPAIRAQATPRFKLSRLRVERARIGLDMRGNSGGATIDDLEISAFDRAVWIDGALDSVKISKLHVWPFGITQAQRAIYDDAVNEGLRIARCDDLHLSDSIIFGLRKAAIFHRSDAGDAFGTISSVDFDHCGGLICEAANLRVVGCLFTLGVPDGVWMRAGKGQVNVVGSWFHARKTLASPGIASTGSGLLSVSSCVFNTGDTDFVHIALEPGTTFNLAALTFAKAQGKSYAQPLILARERASGSMSGLVATSTSGGELVRRDAHHSASLPPTVQIIGVEAPGWRTPG
ncbi:glycoside hydrolase family 55 protein [Rhodomicrobium vannielii]|uniref:glycoside hydrolase family 55 protein n=1 Tax=Rhodomicrobium vannielii TaxID=1069 RepID=UPI001FD9E886|nr:glycoside hydrolase family 55 protein [Rhodomicrobium vannielii]